MKYGIAAVVGLAVLGGIGAWFYTREDEAPKAEEPTPEPQTETPQEEV